MKKVYDMWSEALKRAFVSCIPAEKRNEIDDLMFVTLPHYLEKDLSDYMKQKLIQADARGFSVNAQTVMGANVGVGFDMLFLGQKCDIKALTRDNPMIDPYLLDYFDPIVKKYINACGMKVGVVGKSKVVIYNDDPILF